MELKSFVRIVAVIFMISCTVALAFAITRLLNPECFYSKHHSGKAHMTVCCLMIVTSIIGIPNSGMVIRRASNGNFKSRNQTCWLVLESAVQLIRVIYLFMAQIVWKGDLSLHFIDMGVNIILYIIDNSLLCSVVLKTSPSATAQNLL